MSAVTWGRMRTFLAVVDHGSVRAAAAVLHVTEPAVSAAVASLEKHLGTALLVKDGRGVRVTDAGLVYAGYCRRVLGLLEEAESAVRSAERGRLRIGAVSTASEYVIPPLLASFRRRFPEVDLSLSVRPRDELFAELGNHQTDLVVAGRPPRGSGLRTRARRANRLIVVGAPDLFPDPLAATWLLRGPGSGTRDTTLGLLTQLEASPPLLTLGTHGAVVAAAREGLGVTLVHEDAVGEDLRRGGLTQLPVPRTPVDRPWHVATADSPSASVELFLAHITGADVGGDAFHLLNRPHG
ncbi:MAG TPA: LysR family transcriptional regulator [Nocardioidaceae bacterium]|nr:LysR family transcriptional regulator [Nocardioidaceae bacterium]